MKTDFDIVVIGAGLVGLTTALACADSGASVALLDRKAISVGTDGRASALSTTSLRLFENLDVDLANDLQPIHDMLVTEGTPESPWRLHFSESSAQDGDGGDLGSLIENSALKAALIDAVEVNSNVSVLSPVNVTRAEHAAVGVTLETDQDRLTARLLIAADGRDSVLRRKAGITAQRFDYDAASLVTTISHELPHDGLAWQRLIPGGALAVLPLIGNRSQVVWSGRSAGIEAATKVPDTDFLSLLSEKMDGYLGDMSLEAPRQHYPLRLQVADGFTGVRLALVGDAGHVIHPLAGQGLNLGLRDAAAIADGVRLSRKTGQDIGVASLLEYDLWRNSDTRTLGLLTHFIAESSNLNSGLVGHGRRLSLALANRSTALKSELAKRASGAGGDLPYLMNGS